ncbi:hypothetical protein J6Z39_09070 [bacterium]|nr:hypothetical protein [bacterium]MBP5435954.1 hypothetical protein [bacterium]
MKRVFQDYIEKNITIDDMPTEDMRMIAERCGVDVALSVMLNLAGGRFFVPVNWSKRIAERYIADNASKPVNQLAIETGFSDWMVLRTLQKPENEIGKKKQATVEEFADE